MNPSPTERPTCPACKQYTVQYSVVCLKPEHDGLPALIKAACNLLERSESASNDPEGGFPAAWLALADALLAFGKEVPA